MWPSCSKRVLFKCQSHNLVMSAQVIDLAHASGAMVAMTAGDANVVHRHRGKIWEALHTGVDMLFANRRASYMEQSGYLMLQACQPADHEIQ